MNQTVLSKGEDWNHIGIPYIILIKNRSTDFNNFL